MTGIQLEKIGYYWYELDCWRCANPAPLKDRTRYPNVADTAWACRDCSDALMKEEEKSRDEYWKAMRKEQSND